MSRDVSIEDMREIIANTDTEQDLADAFVMVHNKLWFIEDVVYDYEPGTGTTTGCARLWTCGEN